MFGAPSLPREPTVQCRKNFVEGVLGNTKTQDNMRASCLARLANFTGRGRLDWLTFASRPGSRYT